MQSKINNHQIQWALTIRFLLDGFALVAYMIILLTTAAAGLGNISIFAAATVDTVVAAVLINRVWRVWRPTQKI